MKNIEFERKKANVEAIKARLDKYRNQPEFGKVHISDIQGTFVRRFGDDVELYCYPNGTKDLSDIMTRININDPLHMASPYSHCILLSAVWREAYPKKIYMAGFGGGILPLFFHHYFGDAHIYASDIDENMYMVAEEYFGLKFDERYHLAVADGRQDLAGRQEKFDVILHDVFFGKGDHPNHLATREFFEICKSKLTPNGVMAANIIDIDPLHKEKIAAVRATFQHSYTRYHAGAYAVFGCTKPLEIDKLVKRATAFEKAESLAYPFSAHAKELEPIKPTKTVAPLTDTDLSGGVKLTA